MADEIPISASEQAFLDAMKGDDEQQHTEEAPQQEQPYDPEATTHHDETNSDDAKVKVEEDDDEAEYGGGNTPQQQTEPDSSDAYDPERATANNTPPPAEQSDAAPTTETTANPTPSQTPAPTGTPTVAAQLQIQPPRDTPPAPVSMTATPVSAAPGNKTAPKKKKRLPQDVVGQFEDRIADDPKGDVDAWLGLIEEYKRKGKADDARATYERFFAVFPTAAHQWMEWVNMELNNSEFNRVEHVFSKCLLTVPNVELWSSYLDYIRRRNNVTNDPTGKARAVVTQAYEFVLNNIGMDKESGRIWQDHINFIKSAPGTVGGTTWMDQQKMDTLRKAYQKAITQPVVGVEAMWKEYDGFEHGLNKMTARKFLQERSPGFVTARSSLIALTNITRNLRRDTIPRLPPIPGCEGEDDWKFQLSLWRKWISWEKEDPLVLADEDKEALKNRILYAYKQAHITMRFCPELWYEAAEYCFDNGMSDQGVDFLRRGIEANPESCLLTFKLAEHLESTLVAEDGDAAAIRNGQIVRKPYDELLDHLYAYYPKREAREAEELERIEEEFAREEEANNRSRSGSPDSNHSQLDYDEDEAPKNPRQQEKERRIAAVKDKYKAEYRNICKVISTVWINLMRAMRRIQGHGRVNDPLGGSRGIFADARKRGKITSDVYIASALIEYHCYQDPAALRIFERGIKLFPQDEDFALAYLKHLININDLTNARAIFETFVSKAPPEKCRRIYREFRDYEAQYGELAQVRKLEARIAELYPNEGKLPLFTARHTYNNVNPSSFTPILSPQQNRPRTTPAIPPLPLPVPPPGFDPSQLPIPPPLPIPLPVPGSFSAPLPHPLPVPVPPPPPPQPQQPPQQQQRVASPKRALDTDGDDYASRARKLPRADSPLKGAAGRRLNQARQQQQKRQQQQMQQQGTLGGGLPDAVVGLLRILPGADKYTSVRFSPEKMVGLLAGLKVPESRAW